MSGYTVLPGLQNFTLLGLSRELLQTTHVYTTYAPPSAVMESVSTLIECGDVESQLSRRLDLSVTERLSEGTSSDHVHLEAVSGLSVETEGRWQGANYTTPLRYAPLWRWLKQRSPLAGRTDLRIFGAGIGAHLVFYQGAPLQLTNGSGSRYDLFFCEPLEALALCARDGFVHYFDIKESVIRRAEQFLEEGSIFVPEVRGADGKTRHRMRRLRSESFQEYRSWQVPLFRWLQRANRRDVEWAVNALQASGIGMTTLYEDMSDVTPVTEWRYPEAMRENFMPEAADLLFESGPPHWADLSIALYTLKYISNEPGPLTMLGAIRMAQTVSPEGLLAITDLPLSRAYVEHSALTALGFRLIHSMVPMENHHVIRIYQRPCHDSDFAQDVYAWADSLLAATTKNPQ